MIGIRKDCEVVLTNGDRIASATGGVDYGNFAKSVTPNKYKKATNNIYENTNKQDIMINIFKRVA